jgi:PKD repeat protein
MYKSLLFLLLFVGINKHLRSNTNNEKLIPNIVSAPCNPIISLGTIPSGPFCAGNNFSVPYTFTDCVDAGNVFTVQLSNPIGLFTSPVNIGSISSVAAGSISVTIPINTVFGNGYRIRIVSSAPNAISADNGFNLTINPSPIANFNIVNSAQCVNGNNFQFQNTSTGTIASNAWSFGDGTTSLGSNPSKVYGNAGVYNVKLIVTGNNGCRDSMVKQTTVYPKPNVAFTVAQPCINSSIIQANNTTIASGTVNYFWDFGDLTTSSLNLPLKSYGTVGNQTIKLVATSNNGCKDSLTQNVNIALKPTASFTINNASQCVNGNNFNFTNTSTGAFSNQIWNLGNGVTSNNFSISSFNYASNGVYPVKLLLIGSSGCNDSVTQNVTVSPVPNFSINNASQCLTGNQFIFTNTSIGTLASSSWSFGDGNTASTTNAGNIYNAIGTYTVKLKVTEVGGCTDSITKTVQVIEKPSVGFSVSTPNFCAVTNLQFNNTSSVGIGTLSYLWSFGDGNTSTQANPLKSFSTAGTYQVKLVVTNNNGCKDSLIQNVTILAKPVAAFTVNSAVQCIVGNQFNFTNNSTGVISNYSWNFGDGNTSNVSNPSKSYASSNNYNVKLFANGTNGCVDSAMQTVSVNPKPNVAFSFSNTCLNTPIGLVNNSSISNGTISYLWSFGDGTFSNDLNPLKSYNTPGNYTIKLVATSNSGCKDSLSQTISILPKPVPAFSINSGAQCLQGNNFVFTNNSTSSVSQIWSFGDGNTSTNLNTTHSYTSAGVYIVKLVVTGANGCKDSISQSVTIDQKPTPSFLINNPTQCLTGNSFVFTDNSAGLVTSYAWSFGDGSTSSLQSPTHSYASTGTFPVKLVVSTALGCKDSIIQNIQIVAKPSAAFVVNNHNQCVVGNSFSFTNNSTAASSYEWQFGDGGISNTNNAIYTYSLAGTYTVKLIAISSTGCKDSVTNTVNVLIKPLAAFTVNNITQCLSSNSFVLNNTSTSITNGYLWKFSDGTTSTQTNPIKTFSSVGAYTIKLIVTSDNGCKDSVTQNVSVIANPNPNFSVNNTTQCAGSNFIFTNTSGASSTYSWSFGEGTTSASTNPSFVYSIGGTYTVKLVSTHSNGCKDSISQVVNVLARPSAIFGVNSLSQCLNGNNFITTNLSTGSIASYNWSFGDGTTSTLTNPTNIYSSVGNYLIKLVATGTNGCKDSLQQSISVVSKPNVAFTVNNAVQCITNNSFLFNNTTTGATSYSWIFGDGGVSTLLNPTKVYSTANAYTVKLIATGNNGCKDSLTQNISVIAKPIPSFTINNASQCVNENNFTFNNTSVGGNVYNWSFGDGTTSTLSNPTKVYTVANTYNVTLRVSNAAGCIDSITTIVTVHPKPNIAFTVNGGTACLTNPSVSFINNSTGATNYTWYFGDGSSQIATNPTKVYPAVGTYNVKLVGVSNFSCKDSITQPITIGVKPQASFALNATTACLGSSFVFTNTSTGAIASEFWDFGDGTVSSTSNPIKAYNAVGTYVVKLIITGVNGCKDSLTQNLNVIVKPTVSFTINGGGSCLSTTNISITNTSTSASSYLWSFGDGNTSTLNNPNHTYATQGTYTVKLVATNANGCKDSISQNVSIATKPVAAYTLNTTTQCAGGNNFIFTNTSTGSIASYLWDFGDGIFSNLTNPSKAYAVAGNYTVKLIVTGVNGCKDSVTQNVVVTTKPLPNFSIVGGGNCSNSLAIALTNTSTNASSYVWSFGDGNTSTLANPNHTYATQGTYTIKLVATNANGCKDSISQNVSIATKPVAAYTLNTTTQCAGGSNFVFTNTSTGSIASYYWDFGDGIFSTLTSPSKAYAVAGNYAVKLIVTGVNGCKDSVTQNVVVTTKPLPNFSIVGGGNCSNSLAISLTNTSTIASSYIWSFGDGNTSTLTNPNHTYATQGTYTIKLIATNANGCKDSISQNVSIATKPVAAYTLNTTTQCAGGSNFVFTNTSTGSIASYYWDFGDGIFSTLISPSKAYAVAGNYTVKLVVTGVNGCKDSVTQNVVVTTKPVPSFTILGGGNCSNSLAISLTNTSTNASSYVWSFGDGTTNVLTNPTKTYAAFGNYTIKLIATNANGCVDSFSTNINLSTKPIASYSASKTSVCVCETVNFNNTSTVIGTGYYYWDFGNGIISTDSNTRVAYATPGIYTVKYYITNSSACKDSLFTNITVTNKPIASFTTPNGLCTGSNNITFTNTSTSATSYTWSFGDGSFSTLASPTKTYATFGTYTVKLIASNASGCIDSVSQIISLSSKPAATFTVNSLSQCLDNNRFSFTNNSTAVLGAVYYWTFGDGTVSQDLNPIKSYSLSGVYTVRLFVTNPNGCKDSTQNTVTVVTKPIASFTTPNGLCTGSNNIAFTNTSTGATNYTWSFGDGSFSTQASPIKTYTSFGTYTVKLIASNASGCIDSVSQIISLSSKPAASFTVNSLSQCLDNNRFSFTNNSSAVLGAVYYWTFGDGTVSQDVNPIKTYSLPGVYTVRLFVTNPNGCKDSTQNTVTVVNKPTASFTVPSNVCTSNNTFTFTNTSVGASSFTWSFGDGTISNQASPTKVYPILGTYTVRLIAVNANGCIDSTSQIVSMNGKPITSFNVISTTGNCAGTSSFTMSNTSSNLVSPTYFWQFGNGSTDVVANPSVNYSTPGLYTVRLSVTNSNGCVDTAIQFVTVAAKPTVGFTVNKASQCLNNNSFVFTPIVSNPAITSYVWSFGDGTTSLASNPIKSYSTINSFTVKLIARTASGCLDSAIQVVSVNPPVQANFNASIDLCTSAVSFNNTSTGTSTGFPFTWVFGDGSTSQVASPIKQYATPGSYNVTLYAKNNFCVDSITRVIFVPQTVSAKFSINDTTQCVGSNIFRYSVTNPIPGNTYLWDFGDTTYSSLVNVSKVYTRGANYAVKLIVTNINGCKDSSIVNIQVAPKPAASFIYTSNYLCAGNNIQFVNTSNIAGLSYTWIFGDGTFSNDVSPFKSFANGGVYTVKLLAANSFGCKDSSFVNVLVNEPPKPIIVASALNRCSNTYNFSNSNPGSTPLNYLWNFGDGTTSVLSSLQKAYATTISMVVNVVLTVTDTFGCTAVATTPISLLQKPSVAFTVNAVQQCVNSNSFVLNNTTTGAVAGTTFLWNFGDGTTSSLANPTKSFTNPGEYNIRLIALQANGCRDSVITTVKVNPLPGARISGIASICSGSSANIGIKFFGTAPFNVTYTDGTANFALNNILADTISIPVNPSRSASYRIVQMSDGGSCPISLTQITGTALITVVPATLIARQPADTGACLAGNTRLYVNVTSGPTPSFQWMKNGINIVGQTDSILRFNNLQPADVANYSVRVTSACGVLISNIANVSIGIAPAAPITNNKFVCRNSTPVPLTAIGSNLIWYNAAIGGVASSIPPSPLTTVPGSQIFFVSSNSNFCESPRSSITVTVIDSPRVVLNVSPSSSLLPGQVATITATITPSTLVPSNYFWSKNGVNTVIGTNTISVPFSEIGTYRVNVIFPTTCNVTSDTIRISQRLGFSRAISEKRIFIVPNPVKDVAALYFDSPINEIITVRLIDGFGRIRSAQTLNYLAAFQKVDLNVRNLVPGYYAVEVMNSKGVSIARDILFKYSR